jgi:hypothetical protein
MRAAARSTLVLGAALLGLGTGAPARAQSADDESAEHPPVTEWKPAPPAATHVAPLAPGLPGPTPAAPPPAAGPKPPSPAMPAEPLPAPVVGATHIVHRVRPLALGVGGAVLTTDYIAKIFGGLLLVAASGDGGCVKCAWEEAGLALVPIAGPLLALWADDDSRDRSSTGWKIAGTWSAVEAAAVTMLIVGIVGHDVAVPAPRGASPAVTVVPAVSRHLGALSLQVSW